MQLTHSGPTRPVLNNYHQTGRWLASLGATVTCIGAGDKRPIHKWKHYYEGHPQDVDQLPWRGYTSQDGRLVQCGGVGICSGLGGWRAFDLDSCDTTDPVLAILEALGLDANYPWVVRSGSGRGWTIWILCDEDLPAGALPLPPGKDDKATYWGSPRVAGDFDHLELRWSGCQTLVPPSTHPTGPGYRWWLGDRPSNPPARVKAHQVLAAFFAVAAPVLPKVQGRPQRERRTSSEGQVQAQTRLERSSAVDAIRDRLDILELAQDQWSGQVVRERDGQYRVLGHGGVLVDVDKGVWYQFSGELGGDVLDLLGLIMFGSWDPATDRTDRVKWPAVLHRASQLTGVPLEESRTPRGAFPGGSSGDGPNRGAGVGKDPSGSPDAYNTTPGQNLSSGGVDNSGGPVVDKSLEPDQALAYISRAEVGDAEAIHHLVGDSVAWDPVVGAWYIWDGHRWERDTAGTIPQIVYLKLVPAYADVVRRLADEYAQLVAQGRGVDRDRLKAVQDAQKAIQDRIGRLLTAKRIDNTLKLLKAMTGVPAGRWDAHPYLLAVANGVVDLRTGALLPPDPTLYLRTTSPVRWDGLDAQAPRWERFLDEIFQDKDPTDRAAIIGYLQRLLGYSLTGDTSDHHFSVWWGAAGRNGKGTILTVMGWVLGPLAGKVEKDVLVRRHNAASGAASPHLFDLKGKRFAFVDELSDGEKLNVGQVQELTGGGVLKARPLYGQPDEWTMTHHLVLSTNHRPHVAAEEEAFWQRASLVQFGMRFLKNPDPNDPCQRPQDPNLLDALRAELPGILAWLVRGCLLWQQEGRRIRVPECIQAYTASYREDEDTLGNFLADECVLDRRFAVKAKELYQAYVDWAGTQGIRRPLAASEFGMQMKMRPGIDYHRTGSGRVYVGLALRGNTPGTVRGEDAPVAAPAAAPAATNGSTDAKGLVERLKSRKVSHADLLEL